MKLKILWDREKKSMFMSELKVKCGVKCYVITDKLTSCRYLCQPVFQLKETNKNILIYKSESGGVYL